MTLEHLLPLLTADPALGARLTALAPGAAQTIDAVPAAARPALAAAAIVSRPTASALIVAARGERADRFAAALASYLPADRQPLLWPSPEALPFEQLPFDLEVATNRVAILDRLRAARRGAAVGPVVVATASGLVHLIFDPAELERETRVVRVGERLDIDDLLHWALRVGYRNVPLVQEPGEFARRGGIVDLFPPDLAEPVRLDLFGDDVETIRAFDPGTQRSVGRLHDVRLLPPSELPLWRLPEAAATLHDLPTAGLRPEVAAEWRHMLEQMDANATPASVDLFAPYLLRRPATLVDYFAPGDLVVVDEPAAVALAATQLAAQATELEAAFVANGELPPGLRSPIAAWSAVSTALDCLGSLQFAAAGDLAASGDDAPIVDAPNYAGRLADIVADVRDRLDAGWRISIATDQVDRLTEIFESRDIFPRREKRRAGAAPASPLTPGVLEIRDVDIDGGWALPSARLLALSDLELFGFRKQARRLGRRPGA
ncbi:MAG TPA: hypothetical protein VFQ80_06710, partial [Thermomicrobiales bacterium]|nr:hypothetical protein [Thermomicrobiales bacterium]